MRPLTLILISSEVPAAPSRKVRTGCRPFSTRPKPTQTSTKSSSKSGTPCSSSTSFADKSLAKRVFKAPKAQRSRTLICSRWPTSCRRAACQSSRRSDAGNSSERGCEMSKSVRASSLLRRANIFVPIFAQVSPRSFVLG